MKAQHVKNDRQIILYQKLDDKPNIYSSIKKRTHHTLDAFMFLLFTYLPSP